MQAQQPAPEDAGLYVNETRELAETWFQEDFIPRVKKSKQEQLFLIGDPGAGKSTFIKYLLNKNSEFLMREKVIFSRFEFLKFAHRWFKGMETIEDTLPHYITFILLRDVLTSLAYARNRTGGSVRRPMGPFANERAIAQTMEKASEVFGKDANRLVEWIGALKNALGETEIDQSALASVPIAARILLVQYFAKTHKLVLVLDGLDRISIEDQHFETPAVEIFRFIWQTRTRLTDIAMNDAFVRFDATLVFVMRENTFYFYRDGNQTDVKFIEESTYRVKNIDPRTAIHNAVSRAVRRWATDEDKGVSECNGTLVRLSEQYPIHQPA